MAASGYAQVALPLPVEQPYTYAIPEPLAERAAIGMRAVVPLRNRIETGYIVSLESESPVASPKSILDLPDDEPVLTAHMIDLCQWMADYYCCSLGEALQAAVPSGIQIRSQYRYTLVPEQLTSGRYTERQREIIAALNRLGPSTEAQLAEAVGRGALRNDLNSLTRRGVVLAEALAQDAAVRTRMEMWAVLDEDHLLDAKAVAALQRRAPKQSALYLDLFRNETEQPARTLLARHGATMSALATLEKTQAVRREERELYRKPVFTADERSRDKHALNEEQRAAYDHITGAMDSGKFESFLLRGITGSGKTEVYLQAIEHALALGRGAIVLVPEISLTPQTVGRFLARFDTDIAVLHSGLSPGERFDEWRRALRGEVRIVVGARSAVFAPLPDVGIIIVDEEHDASYKQSETPRYHARDLAIVRAQLCGGVCVLGSATPAVESFFNTVKGKSTRLDLRQRATRGELPKVRLVDMRIEAKEQAGEVVLSRDLEEAVHARVTIGEQVILLLNRRGHSPFVLCPQCGWVAQCENCHVTMTYHARGEYLSCHYCQSRRKVPLVCDECHFNPLIFLGSGTQKLEEYLARAFPTARVERMDRDTTAGREGHARILGRFARREIDILVGTQMIAKGHDYPGVTLVGVLNADAGLALPDFRAGENVFQLLTQVAGRAGRGDTAGEVLVQTYRPQHFVIRAAAEHDYDAFFTREIQERETAAYPPFRRMMNFMLDSTDPDAGERGISILTRLVRARIDTPDFRGIDLMGPAPASIHRVKKRYRWNLGAFSKSAARLNRLARCVRGDFEKESTPNVQLKIDLDPYGLF